MVDIQSMPFYVISPKALDKRREECRSHLVSVGIQPTFLCGLYGPDLNVASGYDAAGKIYQHLPSTHICLALNHWCLWQHVAMSDDMTAVIFEDDVVLPNNFLGAMSVMVSRLPDDWDFFYLGILYEDNIRKDKIRVERVSGGLHRHIGATTWDGACDGLHAYMLNTRGARKMMSHPFNLNEPGDRWISFNLLPFLNTYIWYPSPVSQRSIGKVPDAKRWSSTSGGIKGEE